MPSKYQMWLTNNGGTERLRLPVLPETLTIRAGVSNQSVNIQGLGELVIMQDAAAMTINFSSFFPQNTFPGVQYTQLRPPTDLVEQIKTWKNGPRPIQFVVTGSPINTHFTIEDFTYYEVGGDVGTIQYSITLKEYRESVVRQVAVRRNVAVVPQPVPARVTNQAPIQTHTVVTGDNLYMIARRLLGNSARWPEILEKNRDIISNPNLIFPGQVLRLPV